CLGQKVVEGRGVGSRMQAAEEEGPAGRRNACQKTSAVQSRLSTHRLLRRLDAIAPGDHRAHVVPNARHQHHPDMDDDEQHNTRRAEEMDRARRLSSPEHLHEKRKRRVEPRRHRQSRQYDKRQQYENNREISELLKNVVVLRLFAFGESQPDVLENVMTDISQLRSRRSKIALYVSAPERVCEIREAVQNKSPSEEEMPASPRGEVTV